MGWEWMTTSFVIGDNPPTEEPNETDARHDELLRVFQPIGEALRSRLAAMGDPTVGIGFRYVTGRLETQAQVDSTVFLDVHHMPVMMSQLLRIFQDIIMENITKLGVQGVYSAKEALLLRLSRFGMVLIRITYSAQPFQAWVGAEEGMPSGDERLKFKGLKKP